MPEHTTYRNAIQPNSGPPQSAKPQRAEILGVLIEASGTWVPSSEIAALAQQYNSRLFELRKLGFCIENRVETDECTGVRKSWFRLVTSVAPGPAKEKTTRADSAASNSDDWYERQTGKPRAAVVADKSTTDDLPLFVDAR
jgi:hypothetical protein